MTLNKKENPGARWLTDKIKPRYYLRWRFEYKDGSRPKYGQWSTHDPNNLASFQKTDNIARALIEWRDMRTFKTGVVAHCKGEDFCLFKWEGMGVGPGFYKPPNQEGKGADLKMDMNLSTWIVGLTLVSRYHNCTVYIDDVFSPVITRRPESEQLINYATYGR